MAKLTKKAKLDKTRSVLVQGRDRTEPPSRPPTEDVQRRPGAGQHAPALTAHPVMVDAAPIPPTQGAYASSPLRSSVSLSSTASYRGVSTSPSPATRTVQDPPPPGRYEPPLQPAQKPVQHRIGHAGRYSLQSAPVAAAQPFWDHAAPTSSSPVAREKSSSHNPVIPSAAGPRADSSMTAQYPPARRYDARLQQPRPNVTNAGRHRSQSALTPTAVVPGASVGPDDGNGSRMGGCRSTYNPAMPLGFQAGHQPYGPPRADVSLLSEEPPAEQQLRPSETESDVETSGILKSLRVANPDQPATVPPRGVPVRKPLISLSHFPESLRVPGYFPRTPESPDERTVMVRNVAEGGALLPSAPSTNRPTEDTYFHDSDMANLAELSSEPQATQGPQISEHVYDGSGWGLDTGTFDTDIIDPVSRVEVDDQVRDVRQPNLHEVRSQEVGPNPREPDARRDSPQICGPKRQETTETYDERVRKYLTDHHEINHPFEGQDWIGTLIRVLQDAQQRAHALSLRCMAGERRFADLTRQVGDREEDVERLSQRYAAAVRESEQRMRDLQSGIEARMARMAASHADLVYKKEQQWAAEKAQLQARIEELEIRM